MDVDDDVDGSGSSGSGGGSSSNAAPMPPRPFLVDLGGGIFDTDGDDALLRLCRSVNLPVNAAAALPPQPPRVEVALTLSAVTHALAQAHVSAICLGHRCVAIDYGSNVDNGGGGSVIITTKTRDKLQHRFAADIVIIALPVVRKASKQALVLLQRLAIRV
jgi:hypothetical protein